MADLKEGSKVGNSVIYHHDNLKSAQEIVSLSQTVYPKVFTKGISAHGYGDSHNGTGYLEKIVTATDTQSHIGWGTSCRNYPGAAQNNDFTYGYSYGGYGNAAGDDALNNAGAKTNNNMAKLDMSSETESEVTMDLGDTDKQSRAMFNQSSHSYIFRAGQSIKKHAHSDDSISESAMWTNPTDYTTNGTFSNHYGAGYISTLYSGNSPLHKVNFSNDTYIVVAIPSNPMTQYDSGSNSYGYKTIVQSGGNASYSKAFYNFMLDSFTTAPGQIKMTGETIKSAGNGFNYALGGYGADGQNPYSEKDDQETGIATTLANTKYSMSSAAQFIG